MNPRKLLFGTIFVLTAHSGLAMAGPRPAARDLLPIFYENFVVDCAVSQIKEKGKGAGGTAGHKLLYIQGACRDTSVAYPKVKLCEPQGPQARRDRNAGVTLSVDKVFSNTRFIATDGLDFMFNGTVNPSQPLTAEQYQTTIDAVVASGAARGVRLHSDLMAKKPADMSVERFVAETGIGTDFALSFGRTSRCAFIPVSREEVRRMVDRVNELNEPFVTGKREYHWNGLADNCTHFTDNVISAIGIGKPVGTGSSPLRQAFNFTSLFWKMNNPLVRIPSRSLVKEGERITDRIASPLEMIRSESLRRHFADFGSLPARPGALVGEVAFHEEGNELFEKTRPRQFFDPTGRWDRSLSRLLEDPRSSTLEGNLLAFVERVNEMELAGAMDFERAVRCEPELRDPIRQELFERYANYLRTERDDALRKLRVLRGEMSVEEYLAFTASGRS